MVSVCPLIFASSRRARSAWRCCWRPCGLARRRRCRCLACHRLTARRHSGSWQYRWFHRRGVYQRPQPLRKQTRNRGRRRRVVRCEGLRVGCSQPTGGATPLGQARGGSVCSSSGTSSGHGDAPVSMLPVNGPPAAAQKPLRRRSRRLFRHREKVERGTQNKGRTRPGWACDGSRTGTTEQTAKLGPWRK